MERKMRREADGLLSTLQCSAACAAPTPAPAAPSADAADAADAATRRRPASATYAPPPRGADAARRQRACSA
eukprot:scaffold119382_cov21-Phaeocystis_antarctica.AAC.1